MARRSAGRKGIQHGKSIFKKHKQTITMPQPLSLHDQISRKCIHFNGIMNNACNAGINYADVRIDKPYKFPCLKQGGECPKAEFRTEEQVKELISKMEEDSVKALVAYAMIKDHVSKTKERSGRLPCECGGQLHYTVASVNGHIWARCKSCGISFNE